MRYYFSKMTNLAFEAAVLKIIEELKKEGFGLLTEINVKETLKKKLNVDFRPYLILGVCNSPFAYQALQTEDHIGLLLPCNVIVQQHAEQVEVAAVNPLVTMQAVQRPELSQLAQSVAEKLQKVIENM
ncbi:DUF302 domain-containing protein [candidate division KSB1 bacterium]|nr:DUF302 domain-containing protein [candidate division KSB1 bacterium]